MLLAAMALAAAVHARPVPAAHRRSLPVVVIDPGHGGRDPGALHGTAREDHINLLMAYSLADVLVHRGYRVRLTRGTTCLPVWIRPGPGGSVSGPEFLPRFIPCRTNLRQRVRLAENARANVYIALHCDHYADASVAGPRTYYLRDSDAQHALATKIQAELDAFRSRPHGADTETHYWLRVLPSLPAVTIELGYLTNPQDRTLLETASYRRTMALAIARGLDAYARTHPLTTVAKVVDIPPPPAGKAGAGA